MESDDEKLEITARKLRKLFWTDMKTAAETGTCGIGLYIAIVSMRLLFRGDVQECEGANSLIKLEAERSRRIGIALISARVASKKNFGLGQKDASHMWKHVRVRAREMLEFSLCCWDAIKAVKGDASRWAPVDDNAALRALSKEQVSASFRRCSDISLRPTAEQAWGKRFQILLHRKIKNPDATKCFVFGDGEEISLGQLAYVRADKFYSSGYFAEIVCFEILDIGDGQKLYIFHLTREFVFSLEKFASFRYARGCREGIPVFGYQIQWGLDGFHHHGTVRSDSKELLLTIKASSADGVAECGEEEEEANESEEEGEEEDGIPQLAPLTGESGASGGPQPAGSSIKTLDETIEEALQGFGLHSLVQDERKAMSRAKAKEYAELECSDDQSIEAARRKAPPTTTKQTERSIRSHVERLSVDPIGKLGPSELEVEATLAAAADREVAAAAHLKGIEIPEEHDLPARGYDADPILQAWTNEMARGAAILLERQDAMANIAVGHDDKISMIESATDDIVEVVFVKWENLKRRRGRRAVTNYRERTVKWPVPANVLEKPYLGTVIHPAVIRLHKKKEDRLNLPPQFVRLAQMWETALLPADVAVAAAASVVEPCKICGEDGEGPCEDLDNEDLGGGPPRTCCMCQMVWHDSCLKKFQEENQLELLVRRVAPPEGRPPREWLPAMFTSHLCRLCRWWVKD